MRRRLITQAAPALLPPTMNRKPAIKSTNWIELVRDLAIVLASLAALLVFIGRSYSATPLDASVRISTWAGDNAFDTASGTIIDTQGGHALVISCGHVFRDSKLANVTVTLHDGRVCQGVVQRWSLNPDLSLISVDTEFPGFIPLAPAGPVHGALTAVGNMLVHTGIVVNAVIGIPPYLVVGVPVKNGCSGGGVFNAEGRLVGVIWGSDANSTYATSLPVIRDFIGKTLPWLTACRWERDACGNWVRICETQPSTFVPPAAPPVAHSLPPSQPSVTQSEFTKVQTSISNINTMVTNLQAQVNAVKGCDCDGTCNRLRDEMNVKIENMATAINNLQAVVSAAESRPPAHETPNYDLIADEVGKRLKHSATITLLDGTKKTQTKPLGEPLEFTQHPKGVK